MPGKTLSSRLRSRRRRRSLSSLASLLTLSADWQRWVADNLLRGVDAPTLIATLADQGIGKRRAAREVASIQASPLFEMAKRSAQERHRLELVASVRRTLMKQRRAGVERRAGVSREEFFERYYCAGAPVILTDVVPRWPAFGRWSPDYFRERFGDLPVRVTGEREGDPRCDQNFEAHQRTTTLGEFAARVAAAGPTNDFYMVANNRNLEDEALSPLFEDLVLPEEYLDPTHRKGTACLWFGPAGTVTPLHHDTTNILFCQVFGRKKIKLISPFETALLDGLESVYSPIDAEAPDLARFPWFREVAVTELLLAPGEALFLPVSYWHHVRALDPSISVSFTNFVRENQFDGYLPGGIGPFTGR